MDLNQTQTRSRGGDLSFYFTMNGSILSCSIEEALEPVSETINSFGEGSLLEQIQGEFS